MASQRLDEGAVLGGRYHILEVVGRGGMGTVYRARDSRLDNEVAIKEMAERYASSEERDAAVRQFEREAKLLGQLRHPHLPRVTDYFVEEDRCYLVMEFVVGSTVESLLKAANGGPLPLASVVQWANELVDVLVYLHSQDPPVVFRDLKPANIMVQADGSVKLIDFGIARRFQAGATKDTLLYGSPGYSPPEQYGRAQTDPRSDIYALGATLHHLATGRDPAPAPFKFPPMQSLNAGIPAALDAFVARCLEMEEQRRWQTASEARDRLREIRDGLEAVPTVSSRTSGRFEGSHGSRRTAVPSRAGRAFPVASMVVVIGILVLGGVLAAAYRLRSSAPGRVVAVRPAPKDALPAPPAGGGANLTAASALQVNSTPAGARIEIDGKPAGETPADIPGLAPGAHDLRLIPAQESGLAEYTRRFSLNPGQSMVIDAHLAQIGAAAGQVSTSSSRAPVVEMRVLGAQTVYPAPDAGPLARPGIQVTAGFRISGAAGKSGAVSAFFYGADRATPLHPSVPNTPFQNADGQLAVANSFAADSEPAEFPNTRLFIPAEVFPSPFDQVTWRLIVYVDGKAVYQSPITPLVNR